MREQSGGWRRTPAWGKGETLVSTDDRQDVPAGSDGMRACILASGSRRDIPAGWVRQRRDVPDPADCPEIVPGVRIALPGTGDVLMPDGTVTRAAQVAIWDRCDEQTAALGKVLKRTEDA